MKCLLCGCHITVKLTLKQIILLQPLKIPNICARCQEQFLKMRKEDACPNCGRDGHHGSPCQECRDWQSKLGWTINNYPLYHYHGAIADFMKSYKFDGDYRLRKVFCHSFSTAVKEIAERNDVALIIPIPVTEHTMQTRGFNQVLGLLEDYHSDYPKIQRVLVNKARKKDPQSRKDRLARLKSPQPFKLLEVRQEVKGQTVMLVDDVYTTGRTLYHAATLLKEAGAKRIVSVTLAG